MHTTSTPPRRFLLITMTAGAVALSGCGGSSGSGLTGAQLASKVNAACTSYNAKAQAIPQPRNFATNPAAAAAYLDKVKAVADGTFATVKGLHPADSVKSDFGKYISAETRNLGYLAAADAKAHAKNPTGLQDLATASRFKRTTIDPLATRLGFTSCVR